MNNLQYNVLKDVLNNHDDICTKMGQYVDLKIANKNLLKEINKTELKLIDETLLNSLKKHITAIVESCDNVINDCIRKKEYTEKEILKTDINSVIQKIERYEKLQLDKHNLDKQLSNVRNIIEAITNNKILSIDFGVLESLENEEQHYKITYLHGNMMKDLLKILEKVNGELATDMLKINNEIDNI